MRKGILCGVSNPIQGGDPRGVWQDFTTYTEYEQTTNPLTVWDYRIRAINMANNKRDIVYKAIAGLWDGDLTCHGSIFMSGGGGNPSYANIGAANNNQVAPFTSNFVGMRLNETSTYKRLQLEEKLGTVYNWGGYLTIPASTWAHFRLRVDKAVGAFGTLYLQLFTDNTFTTPTGSEISLALSGVHSIGYWMALGNGYTGVGRLWNGITDNHWLIYGA